LRKDILNERYADDVVTPRDPCDGRRAEDSASNDIEFSGERKRVRCNELLGVRGLLTASAERGVHRPCSPLGRPDEAVPPRLE
jgi:hypothetical protein